MYWYRVRIRTWIDLQSARNTFQSRAYTFKHTGSQEANIKRGKLILTIGQVAHQAKLKTSTLRYYEDIGLIPPPVRLSKQRRYDDSVFQRLALIKLAQRAGFT